MAFPKTIFYLNKTLTHLRQGLRWAGLPLFFPPHPFLKMPRLRPCGASSGRSPSCYNYLNKTLMPQTSLIIRTKNESRFLGKVLEALKSQTEQNFEIIIVDDSSKDATLKIAQHYGCKIVPVPQGKFTHPFSCNLGAQKAQGKYIVYLNGHAIPISPTWLSDGLKNFSDPKVAGVWATPLANPEANPFEKLLYFLFSFLRRKRFETTEVAKAKMGELGTTNAILRADLWQKHHFNEKFARGGEDGEWAKYWLNRGYKIIHDPRFKVYHSHNLGPIGQIKQYLNWTKLGKPRKFKPGPKNLS